MGIQPLAHFVLAACLVFGNTASLASDYGIDGYSSTKMDEELMQKHGGAQNFKRR